MTTEEALADYLAEREIIEPGTPRKQWYTATWFYTHVRGRKLPIYPLVGFRKAVVLHDLHHLLSGYETHWFGECELAAWELASGGCGGHLLLWLDRIAFFPLALLMAPIRTLRAFRRGLGSHNLYRSDPERILALPLDEVRRLVAA